MVGPAKAKRIADGVPNYPGRKAAEAIVRPIVENVGGRWIRHESQRQVLRLVGFHQVWHALKAEGVARPDLEMFKRGILTRRTAYDFRDDFEAVFGIDVDDASSAQVLAALSIPDPSPNR